jgi:hypothetical protein
MKRRRKRRSFAADGNIAAPKIGNGRNSCSGGNNIRVADLQGKRTIGTRLVTERLPMTAYCDYVATVNVVLAE